MFCHIDPINKNNVLVIRANNTKIYIFCNVYVIFY